MERGVEQLFIIAVILLAALIDLFSRWLKRKAGGAQPPPAEEELVVFEEEVESDALEGERVDAPPPPPRAPLPAPRLASASSQLPTRPARRPSSERRAPPAVPHRRRHGRDWLKNPTAARRGIVMMAVLGPCRGLETPRDAPMG